ncbi:Peptidase U32 family protein [uncultured delta proteobacterium]|uniref:Peptidase U32 family protein n=1 Tax=uncultured delta proteobacterium TaxID=34034 RepID=A0A212JDX2_9DELT|nr:Peptidase U32 family protein [uncultured delta proteobacterium]
MTTSDPIVSGHKPEILAPAGDTASALAAFAAGADAVYLGLKHFSARMTADNFATLELSRLVDLAHAEDRKVYVALNTLLKPGDLSSAGRLIKRVCLGAAPDGLIVQDLGALDLARQTGFTGGVFLSTLANVTHPLAFKAAKEAGASRVILPRELSIDEIRTVDATCPEGLRFETFIHGALCWCVSGRCWWSSYMGGKSGLRGRCVQPCRRVYTQKGKSGRFFSCLDLSLDVLVKTLLELPNIVSWKIEGRKKGPHYVYYAVTAYRMLRDEGQDPKARKEALAILDMALGRPFTRARFLPQKDTSPTATDGQTSSGLLAGKITRDEAGAFVLKPRFDLLPQDNLRIGVEDEAWHHTLPVTRRVPKGGTYTLKMPRHKSPKTGTPVFLIDRREPELMDILAQWEKRLAKAKARPDTDVDFSYKAPASAKPEKNLDIILRGNLPKGRDGKSGVKPGSVQGLWLSPKALESVSRTLFSRISWWLPPVIWPDEEEGWLKMIRIALRNGARHFVCNEPWQSAFFPDDKAALVAGPFCNITNPAAVAVLKDLGFSGAFVGPELGDKDMLSLPRASCLPMGVVLSGYWPMGIARHGIAPLKPEEPFVSPKGEGFWARRYGQNTWIYPTWPLDITARRQALEKAGYSMFAVFAEWPPQSVGEAKRTSEFNWDIGML